MTYFPSGVGVTVYPGSRFLSAFDEAARLAEAGFLVHCIALLLTPSNDTSYCHEHGGCEFCDMTVLGEIKRIRLLRIDT